MHDLVVISPHLDDAVFSLGASIYAAARAGAQVTVLTVLAGDPGSLEPAGAWDREARFAHAGSASASRRAEDARACAILGAVPVWLPFGDEQYARGGSDDEVRALVVNKIAGADLVLLPGFPLLHDDHRWVAELLDGDLGAGAVAEYVEQPYAALAGLRATGGGGWEAIALPYVSVGAKHRAARAYPSQISLLPSESLSAIRITEARSGGEKIRQRSGSRKAYESVVRSLWPARARPVPV